MKSHVLLLGFLVILVGILRPENVDASGLLSSSAQTQGCQCSLTMSCSCCQSVSVDLLSQNSTGMQLGYTHSYNPYLIPNSPSSLPHFGHWLDQWNHQFGGHNGWKFGGRALHQHRQPAHILHPRHLNGFPGHVHQSKLQGGRSGGQGLSHLLYRLCHEPGRQLRFSLHPSGHGWSQPDLEYICDTQNKQRFFQVFYSVCSSLGL